MLPLAAATENFSVPMLFLILKSALFKEVIPDTSRVPFKVVAPPTVTSEFKEVLPVD